MTTVSKLAETKAFGRQLLEPAATLLQITRKVYHLSFSEMVRGRHFCLGYHPQAEQIGQDEGCSFKYCEREVVLGGVRQDQEKYSKARENAPT